MSTPTQDDLRRYAEQLSAMPPHERVATVVNQIGAAAWSEAYHGLGLDDTTAEAVGAAANAAALACLCRFYQLNPALFPPAKPRAEGGAS